MQKEAGMKMVRLFVLTLLVFVGVSVAGAQDPLRFRFDITRDGKTVANPELTVAAGGTGHLTFDGIRGLAFTPTLRDSASVSVVFDIDLGGRHLRPQLTLGADDPGSLSWTSSGRDSFKVTVAWIR
jgi:hypothetical protein